MSFYDGDTLKAVMVEIQPGNCASIPEAAKETLEFFFDNYSKYKEVLAEAILEYYYECKASWGPDDPDDPDDPKFPEVKDEEELTKMYSINYILIHDTERNEKNILGLLYDCTWDT